MTLIDYFSGVQVLVPSLLVPSQSVVCHVCVQHPVCTQHPLLLLLQRSPSGTTAHEYLLVPGEDTKTERVNIHFRETCPVNYIL